MSEEPKIGPMRICDACGAPNPPVARFCANCGHRLVDEASLEQAFESTIADVVDDPAGAGDAPSNERVDSPTAVDQPSLALSGPTNELGWPTATAAPAQKTNKVVLFVVLGILTLILLCCCGFGLIILISAANDTGLQRDLSWLA